MSQYNKLSDIQYARFHILPVDLHFETVLVSWYPHYALHVIVKNKVVISIAPTCEINYYCIRAVV